MRKEARSIHTTRRALGTRTRLRIPATTPTARRVLPRRSRNRPTPSGSNRTQQRHATTRRLRALPRRVSAKATRIRALFVAEVVLVRRKRELVLGIAARVSAKVTGRGVARNAIAELLVRAADVVEV